MVQATRTRTIQVTVNTKPVTLTVDQGKPELTGMAIKEMAINQGVEIQLDFPLFIVTPRGLDPVGDDEAVIVHEKQQFRAVTPDDNS